ncbi:MAG: YraN family protein [Terracidiphilus sp.]
MGAAFALIAQKGRQWWAMKFAAGTRVGMLERVVKGLDVVAARRGRAQKLPPHLATGIEGEEAVYFYLLRKGYTVVARRWSAGNVPGDVDLIAWQGPVLCFIEVKTRTAHDLTPAETAVDAHKRSILRRLARQYVRQLSHDGVPQSRFDVISVYLVPGERNEFTHFENAFAWGEHRRK